MNCFLIFYRREKWFSMETEVFDDKDETIYTLLLKLKTKNSK